jgi:hypothetical protein
MRFAAVVASAFLCFWTPVAVAEEPPAALVMAVSGGTTPAMSEMSEIPSGTPVRLAPGAELTVLDYARCKMVTVSGGTLSVTRFDFTTDGKITAQMDAPCPRVHQLNANAGGAVAGGLVVRGVASVPRWPLNREIVLAGTGADKLKAAAIYAEDRPNAPLVRLDISGHQARFPAGAVSLAPNQRYVLRLTMADRAEPVDISFIGTAPSGPSLLVVLRGQ